MALILLIDLRVKFKIFPNYFITEFYWDHSDISPVLITKSLKSF